MVTTRALTASTISWVRSRLPGSDASTGPEAARRIATARTTNRAGMPARLAHLAESLQRAPEEQRQHEVHGDHRRPPEDVHQVVQRDVAAERAAAEREAADARHRAERRREEEEPARHERRPHEHARLPAREPELPADRADADQQQPLGE